MSNEIKEFLNGVVGVVEASSYETMKLWETFHQQKGYTWVQNNGGPLVTVGYINERPVCISLFVNTIKGHKVLFMEATSALVDWVMIDKWLEENLPKTAFREGCDYINKVDAGNFHNVLPRS